CSCGEPYINLNCATTFAAASESCPIAPTMILRNNIASDGLAPAAMALSWSPSHACCCSCACDALIIASCVCADTSPLRAWEFATNAFSCGRFVPLNKSPSDCTSGCDCPVFGSVGRIGINYCCIGGIV